MKRLINISLIIIINLAFLTLQSGLIAQDTLMVNDKQRGKIVNNGVFRVVTSGSLYGMPDTIGGKVEFIADNPSHIQIVPNITYTKLLLTGRARKVVDSVWNSAPFNPLATLDSLVVDSALTELMVNKVELRAKSSVKNNSKIKGYKDVRLYGDVSQSVEGEGRFSMLNVDNAEWVDVVNGGGFHVATKLELTRGELRNTPENNFTMADSSLIVRHPEGSLAMAPEFENSVNVRYVGGDTIVIGAEIPEDSTKLYDLFVENQGGLTLNRSITVNDSLFLTDVIRTEEDTTDPSKMHVLNYTSWKDPVFAHKNAEIDGSIRRTRILFNDSIYFNNPYTYALFDDADEAGRYGEMTFRVKPRVMPRTSYAGDVKVQRSITITALDTNGFPIEYGARFEVGYGWRYSQNPAIDETGTLKAEIDSLLLQRWVDLNQEYEDVPSSERPPVYEDSLLEWAFSRAKTLTALGNFAIGMPGGYILVFNGKVFLEGAYRGDEIMATDLLDKNLIPATPPDQYPYNLDPDRESINVVAMPDSVVDWIVLEFRKKLSNPSDDDRFYKTALLRSDGRIVDVDGESSLPLSRGKIVDSGQYYVAVRHRNHLTVVTADPLNIYRENNDMLYDFSQINLLYGGLDALKPLGKKSDGSILFGMVGGDNPNFPRGIGLIEGIDKMSAWDFGVDEGYLNADFNLNGIINTRDYNISWNNQNRRSLIK